MNVLTTAQRLSRRTMERWANDREERRVARRTGQALVRERLWAASERDKLRAELAKSRARLEVLERMLREVGEAQERYEAAESVVASNLSLSTMRARADALGTLLARVDVAVRFACQTPVIEEKA